MKINTESEYQTRYLYPSLIQQGKTPEEAIEYIKNIGDPFRGLWKMNKQLTKRLGVNPARAYFGKGVKT